MEYQTIDSIEEIELDSTVEMITPYVIHTIDNAVIFLSNATCTNKPATAVMLVLPENCRPLEDTVLPVCYVDSLQRVEQGYLIVYANGDVVFPETIANGVVFLNGVTFNNSSLYYNEELGTLDKGTAGEYCDDAVDGDMGEIEYGDPVEED